MNVFWPRGNADKIYQVLLSSICLIFFKISGIGMLKFRKLKNKCTLDFVGQIVSKTSNFHFQGTESENKLWLGFSNINEHSVHTSSRVSAEYQKSYWELTVLKEKTLFCRTKHPKRSRLPETLHLCEVAKEHFFFPDKNPLKLRRTSVSEVESMSRNSDSFV